MLLQIAIFIITVAFLSYIKEKDKKLIEHASLGALQQLTARGPQDRYLMTDEVNKYLWYPYDYNESFWWNATRIPYSTYPFWYYVPTYYSYYS